MLIYFIIAIGILIIVHELGHFITARLFGIKVEEFSVGFGPPLLSFNCCKTTVRLRIFPLGGFVKMAGEDPSEMTFKPYEFYSKPLLQRSLVVLAGPLANLLLAIVVFCAVFALGKTTFKYVNEPPIIGVSKVEGLKPGDRILEVNHRKVSTWREFVREVGISPRDSVILTVLRNGKVVNVLVKPRKFGEAKVLDVIPRIEPVIGKVYKGMPAEKSGLKPGDRVLSVNGKKISDWHEFTEEIKKSGGEVLTLEVLRKGKIVSVRVKPVYNQKLKKYVIGTAPEIIRYSLIGAVKEGFREFKSLTVFFFRFLKDLLTGEASFKSLGGPIMIAQAIEKAASTGILNYLYLLGFISLQLGYINLLPLPVLDGGLLVLFFVEALRKKQFSPKTREVIQQVGFAILGVLMTLVIYNDILRLVNKK